MKIENRKSPSRLIINADDLGFSRAVTDGILHSHKHGVLTSATLMTTMPDRDRALDLAAQSSHGAANQPPLGVGIHLSLTQGTPLTRCSKILSRDGHFFRSLPRLFLRLRSQDARLQAQDELIAQIRYAQSRGLAPTHVDSHKHVCHFPPLHAPLITACLTTGIHSLRTTRERPLPNIPPLPATSPYRLLVRFAQSLATRATAANLYTPDHFLGLSTTGKTTNNIYQALSLNPPTGTTELMVHPGYPTDLSPTDTRLLSHRLTELEALCHPTTLHSLLSSPILLIPYLPNTSKPQRHDRTSKSEE